MSTTTEGRTLDEMRGTAPARTALTAGRRTPDPSVAPEQHMPNIKIGFGNMQSWEFTYRVARMFAASNMVPESYRAMVPAGKFGEARKTMIENANAVPNCIIALNMAERLGADPLMVMQNLYMVEGRPAWSAQFVIASINSCGRYSTIQYVETIGDDEVIEYETEVWDDAARAKVLIKKKFRVPSLTCIAWAIDKATGARLESTPITMKMAVLEGWYDRKGSKWQTPLRTQMLRYRAASFFGRAYCPDLLMGLRTVEEEREIIEAEQQTDGSWQVPGETIDQAPAKATATAAAAPAQITEEVRIPVDLTGKPASEGEKVEVERSEPSQAQKDLQAALERGRTGNAEVAPGASQERRQPAGEPPAKVSAPAGQQTGMDLGELQPKPPADDDAFGSAE